MTDRVTVADLIKYCAEHDLPVEDAVLLVESGSVPVFANDVDRVVGRDERGERYEGFSLTVYGDDTD